MSRKRLKSILLAYQLLAGFGDTLTGGLLVISPAWTLRLMGISHPVAADAGMSFIGVFVLSVGLAYVYASRLPMDPANAPRWQTVWFLTALSRTLVAAFLGWQIVTGRMEAAWLQVAFTDGALGAVQWLGLAKGWLRFDRE